MGYSKEERLEIGRQIYEDEINKHQAASRYGICEDTARNYMREYRDANHLPAKEPAILNSPLVKLDKPDPTLDDYENMSKAELIDALLAARIDIARLKKGYEVKGVGAKKRFVRLGNKNTR